MSGIRQSIPKTTAGLIVAGRQSRIYAQSASRTVYFGVCSTAQEGTTAIAMIECVPDDVADDGDGAQPADRSVIRHCGPEI